MTPEQERYDVWEHPINSRWEWRVGRNLSLEEAEIITKRELINLKRKIKPAEDSELNG